jgi:hypothetical protein
MNIKIKMHYMPWEVDFALLQFMQLKKSSQHLSDDKIYFHIGLNLSSYIIDWDKSKLPKEYFINKFNVTLKMLDWAEEVKVTTYDGDELWGAMDLEKTQIDSKIDYYMSVCPDMWFHEYTLFYIIEAAKQIKDKYFIVTPEIHKMWDWTWDELVNENYKDLPYEDWNKSDIFEVQSRVLGEPYIQATTRFKYAGWFDLYSKDFIELIPVPDDWKGYGPWDYYSMLVSDIAVKNNIDIKEYVLKNQIVCEYHPDKDDKNNFIDYTKNLLSLNKIENQRHTIESKFSYYIQQWVEQAKNKKLI